jgi:hypothetical protein
LRKKKKKSGREGKMLSGRTRRSKRVAIMNDSLNYELLLIIIDFLMCFETRRRDSSKASDERSVCHI